MREDVPETGRYPGTGPGETRMLKCRTVGNWRIGGVDAESMGDVSTVVEPNARILILGSEQRSE